MPDLLSTRALNGLMLLRPPGVWTEVRSQWPALLEGTASAKATSYTDQDFVGYKGIQGTKANTEDPPASESHVVLSRSPFLFHCSSLLPLPVLLPWFLTYVVQESPPRCLFADPLFRETGLSWHVPI